MKVKTPKKKTLTEKVGNVTIPIYETPAKGYTGYTVAWHEAGERQRKFFASRQDARTHARLVATKIENAERQVLRLTPEDSRLYVDALAILKPLKIPLDSAARELVAAREIVGDYPILQALKFWKTNHDSSIPEMRVVEVIDELVNGLESDGASRAHVQEMRRALGKFADAFQTNIGNITTANINDYLRGLPGTAGTRNVYRRKIVTLFNFARRVGYLPDRTTAASKSAVAKEAGAEIEIYDAEEMSRLLQHSGDNLKPFVVLCGFCGLRAAEAMRLDWSEIDFERGTVLVSAGKSKTKARRFAPLMENTAAWLRPLAQNSGKVVTVVMIVNALRRLGIRSGVKMKRNGLRHSFVSYRLAQTQNANQTALEAGHSADILFKHYRQLCTEAQAQTWFSIMPETSAKVVPMVRET